MIRIFYYREDADVNDMRTFNNMKELNEWLSDMHSLKENYCITYIEVVEEGS